MGPVSTLFYMDVAKIDQGCCTCCNCFRGMLQEYFRVFQMFQWYVSFMFFECMLQLCLFRCCICITHMLHVFYSDVAYGCSGFQVCFMCIFQVFYKYVLSVSTVFRRMLQPLYLDVSKVDWVLYLSSSHHLLHRLSRSRQGIHTNEGWAMGAG
jgi:hypothetical protein